LLSEKSLKRGIARPEILERYVNEHISAQRDYTSQIWTLLMLELWFQRFID
jgi:asparagine synthase (glutamine-hydrolysing)